MDTGKQTKQQVTAETRATAVQKEKERRKRFVFKMPPKGKKRNILIFGTIAFIVIGIIVISSLTHEKYYAPLIHFKGANTLVGLYKDIYGNIISNRDFEILCPKCLQPILPAYTDPIPQKIKRCRNEIIYGGNKKYCKLYKFQWPEKVTCPFCSGSGICDTCKYLEQEQEQGKCFNCRGLGYIQSAEECPNCKGPDGIGTGKCPICKGSTKCDYCDGVGALDIQKLWGIWAKKFGITEFETGEEATTE